MVDAVIVVVLLTVWVVVKDRVREGVRVGATGLTNSDGAAANRATTPNNAAFAFSVGSLCM